MNGNPARHPGNRTGPTRIWLLDIDGTLMPTRELDNRCYWRAIDDAVGGAPDCLDLDGFEHVTDGGVLDEWMRRTRGRAPTAAESTRIRRRFLDVLAEAWRQDPATFRPTPGLVEWLDATVTDGGAPVALATGGWPHTARFKLRAAGLVSYRLPLASSDDATTRAGIMRIARQRAAPEAGGDVPVTYVGDGPWDLRASRELGWDFVGIADGAFAERLTADGAERIMADFHGLASATSPGSRPDAERVAG